MAKLGGRTKGQHAACPAVAAVSRIVLHQWARNSFCVNLVLSSVSGGAAGSSIAKICAALYSMAAPSAPAITPVSLLSTEEYASRFVDPFLKVLRTLLLHDRPLDPLLHLRQLLADQRAALLLRDSIRDAKPLLSLPSGTTDTGQSHGKFDTFVHPSGTIHDYHRGISARIGFPHLRFLQAMEAEHTSMTGCEMQFTTRNYGITTTPKAEWAVVVKGEKPCAQHMLHGRVVPSVDDRLQCAQARRAGLRREEVIAVVLYTGPMYMIYNCVLARWSNPPSLWQTLSDGSNRFTTTLSVLVSAVQKLSAVAAIPDGLRLYRGTGGLTYLPEHFTMPDEHNCKGMTEWGFFSCSTDKRVALRFSGVEEGRPHAMVLEVEPSCADRGATVVEFSQYPGEEEMLFLPMSYVQQTGRQRAEQLHCGHVVVIPVRVNVNLKAERLEQLEESKKSIHITEFEYRVNELRERLQELAQSATAEARLKRDRDKFGHMWKKTFTVAGCIEALVSKVQAILAQHRVRPAVDYSNDALYRGLVAESLDAARMAEAALLWWLRDEGQPKVLHDFPLMQCQRYFESFLRLRHALAPREDERRAAALELCKARDLLLCHPNERDHYSQSPLLSLAVHGGSADDLELLVTAGADVAAADADGRSAVYLAAQQGHVEAIVPLCRARASCDQPNNRGGTPLWIASQNGHLRCVDALLQQGADVNKARGSGATPLYAASQYGHAAVVEVLLGCGALVNKAAADGATALHAASQNGHAAVVCALVRAGADVNAASGNGCTPLFRACENGQFGCVEALLHAGADLNLMCDNQTALAIAASNGHADVMKLMRHASAPKRARVEDGKC